MRGWESLYLSQTGREHGSVAALRLVADWAWPAPVPPLQLVPGEKGGVRPDQAGGASGLVARARRRGVERGLGCELVGPAIRFGEEGYRVDDAQLKTLLL